MSSNQIRSMSDAPRMRWLHLGLGLCAGAAFWAVNEWGWDTLHDRSQVFALMFVLVGFGIAGILLAEIGAGRALVFGGGMGIITGGLVALGVGNFNSSGDYFRTGHVIIAILVVTTLPVPFALGWLRDGRQFSYRHLFMDSWTIVVRYAAAVAFAGLAFMVAFACSELLGLVGVDLLRDLLREDFVIEVLLGGLVGLGLAVVAELNDLISPYLLLRLVRLLTPFVLAVLAVFLAMIPVRGLTELFGGVSSGGSFMAAGLGAVALVSIVVDRGDLDGPSTGVLYWSARVMSGLVVVLGGLSAAAVWLRVGQYGWTPERVSAAAVALVVLGYGIAYAIALLRGGQWRAGVRAGNWAMALWLIAFGCLWLNPWVTPESISAQSQMARFDHEKQAERAPIWELAHDWGRFGEAAIAELRAEAGPLMAARLATLDETHTRYNCAARAPRNLDERARVMQLIPVLPEGRALEQDIIQQMLRTGTVQQWEQACARLTPQGHPSCLVVYADLKSQAPGDEVFVVQSSTVWVIYRATSDGSMRSDYSWFLPQGMTPEAAIDLFWSEGVSLAPSQDQVFSFGGRQIGPDGSD